MAFVSVVQSACSSPDNPNVLSTLDAAAEYHGILLTSGHVFFGHVESTADHYLVITDVYYFRPESAQAGLTSALVRRGNERHEPTRTVINSENILFIEPVGPNSSIAAQIAELKRRGDTVAPAPPK